MAGAGGSSEEPATETAIEKEQETLLIKKYGGMYPKRPPLIAKDNERAFFDSADWALCKQGVTHQHQQQHQLTRLQSLPPKLTPTPHQPVQARRASSYAPNSVARRLSTEDPERRRERRIVSMVNVSETYAPGSAGSSGSPPNDQSLE